MSTGMQGEERTENGAGETINGLGESCKLRQSCEE